MANDKSSPAMDLFRLIWPGALVGQAIHVAARLKLADEIDAQPRDVEALARATDSQVDPLRRTLRVLTSVGVFAEEADGRFGHTALSRTLRTDHPESTRAWAVFLGAPWIWRPWGELYDAVRTGRTPFDRVFGKPMYAYMAEHPEDAAIYDAAMSSGSAMVVQSIVAAFDFTPFERIVDVGGGQGQLLKGILEANPVAKGVLFDRPRVLEGADPALREGGGLATRCELVGGDFFEGLPGDGDLYVLKGIIHGFADREAVTILKHCRRGLRTGGRVAIIEAVPDKTHEANPQKAFMDLMMLALVPGRERSREDFEPLLAEAGLELEQVVATPGSAAIVVARAR